jgi:hypothetical protein
VYYTTLYYTTLYYTTIYYTILYCTILYYTKLYCTLLYSTLLYSTLLYYTILYYTILYYTILYYAVPEPKLLYCIIPYYTYTLRQVRYMGVGAGGFFLSCCSIFFWHYLKCFEQTTRLVASEGYHVVVNTSNFVNRMVRQKSENIGKCTGGDSVTG